MSQVKIITDTVAGIPADMAQQYDIRIVPAADITVNGHSFIEGIDLSVEQAYKLIEKDPDKFITSAISPGFLMDVYREISKKTSEVLFISISSALTALNKTANFAAEAIKEEIPGMNIKVFDSKTCAGAQGLVVVEAARAAQKGMALNDIISLAQKIIENTGYFVYIDTLRYVYRTGRMSKLASRMAAMFNVRPISKATREGTIEFITRVKSRKAGMEKLLQLVEEDKGKVPMHFWVMHADAPEFAGEFCQLLKDNFTCLSMTVSPYSPVMGYGTGRGALSVGFHPELNLF